MATPNLLQDTIRPTLLRMTLPMMVGIVSLMLFNLADIYFVSLLGTAPMAALAFTFPVTFSVVSLAIGFGIGTSAILARLIGEGQQEKAAELATDNLMMTLLLVLGISLIAQFFMTPLFTLMGATEEQLPYILAYMNIWWFGAVFLVTNMVANSVLRARGDTKTPALVMAVSSVLNMLLDPLLIFGWGPVPAMGIQGAAMASVIAWTGIFIVVIYVLYQRYKLIILMRPIARRVFGHWLTVMKIGVPAALSNMMTPIAGGVLTAMVAQHGAEAVAAFGVGNRLESLSLLVCLALSMTLPPFVSQNFGAGHIHRVITAYQGAIKFALIWQLLVFVLLWIFRESIADLFAASELIKAPLLMWLSIVPLGFGMQAVIFLSASTLNALHQPLRAMRISILRLFVFFIPMAWIANEVWGLQGMFVAFVLANSAASLVAYRVVSQLLVVKCGSQQ
ncbi:MATE family efflux transporter [Neptunomonas antarctica]|uniref:Putative efflux protein, MATE family n=1 Tax=Neptunomonas antarctica TaxID=619304 RepID=A0A1N7NLL8_9GAMM|nr:MATE family efflux transporter [Neptunomonas antarctica]SIS99069.1 putative efflux protein, MATE family [Neptunomonas antarctica]